MLNPDHVDTARPDFWCKINVHMWGVSTEPPFGKVDRCWWCGQKRVREAKPQS